MPKIVNGFEELVEWLSSRADAVVALDGYHGAGKSTLALELSSRLDISVVHADAYLARNLGAYIEALDIKNLRPSLQRRPVLLDSVCTLKLLDKLNLQADAVVYVKCSAPGANSRLAEGPLAAEVAEYHKKYKPEMRADVIYRREILKEWPKMDSVRASIDIAYINAKTRIAMVLAAGGIFTLLVGLVLLFYGISGPDKSLIKLPGVEISAGGLGGVIMATSVAWAYFSYRARPSYSHSTESAEKYDARSRLLERTHRESSTQAAVDPKRHSR